jgi:hypothetical protein
MPANAFIYKVSLWTGDLVKLDLYLSWPDWDDLLYLDRCFKTWGFYV